MGYIKKETIDAVNDTADLIEVIQEYVDLKKSGANYKGLSPFNEENTGSFMVSPAKGIWKDFSSGNGGCTAVDFLMKKEGFSYPEAIKFLAKKYHINVEYDDSEKAREYQEKEQTKDKLRVLLESVIRRFEDEFKRLPEDHPAKIEVFHKRKYSSDAVDSYRIGYAPGKKFIYDLCDQAGMKKEAFDLGLINDKNDKWYNRIIYPLIDVKGKNAYPVGLAGRSLVEDKKYAKWLNSPENLLYQKRSFWYGLNTAREEIIRREEVWIVEGYNDVIAWQTKGIPNTIASCGTSFSENQIRVLKKLKCEKVIFCLDPDDGGLNAMIKYIPEFMRNGFRVFTVALDPPLDPDDFVRYASTTDPKIDIAKLGADPTIRKDGFRFLMEEAFKGKDELGRASETKKLVEIISTISDVPTKTIMAKWLAKESGVTLAEIKKLLKEEKEQERDLSTDQDGYYVLPPAVKESLEELRPEIEKYQMFMANNQIWVQSKKEGPPYSFVSVSNFSIRVITHMHDEKFPMKLVQIKNIHGLERIFDMKSSDLNTPMSFENAVTAQGNFRWKGGRNDHELLKTYLMDKMGTGRKIDILGWQPEGFWIWNNKISDPQGTTIDLDENGVFEKDGVSYYVPSANSIYRSNLYKYESQKKFVCIKAPVSFEEYASQVFKVHRNHGMTAILFSIATIFQDIVVSEINAFPMLFLVGPPASGKDQLANVCQSFFGVPQTGINLEGRVSTAKAEVREFAQFANAISQLSEYKNGDEKLDGVLKGLWDRRGYKVATIESKISSDSIPILSSVLMTGNYAPEQDALISRLVWEFMDKTSFSKEEIEEYNRLNDLTKKGISSYTHDFLLHRKNVEVQLKKSYRSFRAILSDAKPEADSRVITNLSVLGAFYDLFRDTIRFPFNQIELMDHFEYTVDKTMNKMDSASVMNKWWHCFLESMRGNIADQLTLGRDFKVEGDKLFFNFTNCYNRISRQWRSLYNGFAPAKGVMQDKLKKEPSWIGDIKATRMGPGRKSTNTSAYIVDLGKISIGNEIRYAIEFQDPLNTYSGTGNDPIDAPKGNTNGKKQRDLPF